MTPGGVSDPGGVCPGGLSDPGGLTPGGVSASVHAGITPPPVNRITHACENITLPNFVAGGNKGPQSSKEANIQTQQ